MRVLRVGLSLLILVAFSPTRAFGQFVVDCTGNTPGAYTTINSVLPLLTGGAVVSIVGTCTENVGIPPLNNLWIGAPWGQTMNLQGVLNISGVQNLFLHGMNVTNPAGLGVFVTNSSGVVLDDCTSSKNGSTGLFVSSSSVTIQNTGAFNNNGSRSIFSEGPSFLQFDGTAGPISISDNLGGGIFLQDGVLNANGNLVVSGNISGYGIQLQGHARAELYVSGLPPNVISGNQSGGVSIQESSEVSLSGDQPTGSATWQTNIVDGNGPVGVSVGFGSQVTLYNGVQILDHSDAGVDAYGHSQVYITGSDQITNNATGPAATYPTRAGVRVEGNSEAYIRGGQISQNGGPGILALANSSMDISGATLTSNLGGPIECDSSAWLVSDQTTVPSIFGTATACKTPGNFGPQIHAFPLPPIPGNSQMLAEEAEYRKLMSSF